MTGFKRHRRSGAAVATFTVFEADLLRSRAAQLIELLRNESATAPMDVDPLEAMLDFSGPTSAPEDPVLARLFPTAYPDDEEAAGDFRRFTESTLRDGKAAAAAQVSTPAPQLADDTPLRIPFGNKEAALRLGARYRAGGWYAPSGTDLDAFRERGWL